MLNLTRDTILCRIQELAIKLDSFGFVEISHNGFVIRCGAHGLDILSTFSRARSLNNGLESLRQRVRSSQDWMNLLTDLVSLHDAGILITPHQKPQVLGTNARLFDAAGIHIKMLNDRSRTARYIEAIERVIREGDVVVDMGTGTGVLAMAAARSGASQVYAIEASSIAELAQAIFEANSYGNRITLINGWSTQIALLQRADLLVSEIIGNEPLGEHILEYTHDAKERFLATSARMIPSRLRIFATPVTLPDDKLAQLKFTESAIQDWREWYGMDFSAALAFAPEAPYRIFVKPAEISTWLSIGEPVQVADLDLSAIESFIVDSSAAGNLFQEGRMDAVIISFEAELAPGITIANHPFPHDDRCSWRYSVWVLPKPYSLTTHDTYHVTYKYRVSSAGSSVSVQV